MCQCADQQQQTSIAHPVKLHDSLLSILPPLSITPGKMIKEMMDKQVLELKKLWQNKRQLLFQVLNLAMIVFSALMIWKGLMFATRVRKCSAL
jgi:hypothetical protein